jgi:NAD+ kinase
VNVVAMFVHSGRPEAIATGREVAAWLRAHGLEPVAFDGEAELLGVAIASTNPTGLPAANIGLVVAIGGDGTVLRATRWAVAADADLIGVNLGQLGYLAEVEPSGWADALASYLAGTHSIAPRMMVSAEIRPANSGSATTESITGDGTISDVASPPSGFGSLPLGLNEVVVEKQAIGRTIRLGVSIDGRFFTSYVADGIILATPTGSTAYSLSARGPIVDPSHRAILLTPVSPHSLFDRALVLDPASTVEIKVLGERAAAVSVDGTQQGALDPGHRLLVRAAPTPARFVTFGGRDFHQILKSKFGLNDR